MLGRILHFIAIPALGFAALQATESGKLVAVKTLGPGKDRDKAAASPPPAAPQPAATATDVAPATVMPHPDGTIPSSGKTISEKGVSSTKGR